MVASKYRKSNEKVYTSAYLSFHYSRAWVHKTTHSLALKKARKLGVPVTEFYAMAVHNMRGK